MIFSASLSLSLSYLALDSVSSSYFKATTEKETYFLSPIFSIHKGKLSKVLTSSSHWHKSGLSRAIPVSKPYQFNMQIPIALVAENVILL